MASIAEAEELVLSLSESQRAALAVRLLASLPPVLADDDDGVAEALRRDAEMEADPHIGITLEQLDRETERRRT